jgi:hypothetical protein
VERLARSTYGDTYNFPKVPYQRALGEVANKQEEDAEDSETESDRILKRVVRTSGLE